MLNCGVINAVQNPATSWDVSWMLSTYIAWRPSSSDVRGYGCARRLYSLKKQLITCSLYKSNPHQTLSILSISVRRSPCRCSHTPPNICIASRRPMHRGSGCSFPHAVWSFAVTSRGQSTSLHLTCTTRATSGCVDGTTCLVYIQWSSEIVTFRPFGPRGRPIHPKTTSNDGEYISSAHITWQKWPV